MTSSMGGTNPPADSGGRRFSSAARVLIQLQGRCPGTLSEEQKIRKVIDEVKAQGYEAWWAVVGDRAATIPAKRVELIQFIEGKTGRPLPLESEDDPA